MINLSTKRTLHHFNIPSFYTILPIYCTASTGMLLTNVSLDYEAFTSYEINVTATDGGSPPLTGSTRITVTIVDENDNSPIFSASTYRQSIAENSPEGSVVEVLFATDEDSTTNGQIVYSLLERTEIFEVDNSSGIVTVRDARFLDYEVEQSFSLLVEARDMGVPPRVAQALVSKIM